MLAQRYWQILRPFHKTFYVFLALVVVYEALQVFESYTVSMFLKLVDARADIWTWVIFFGALVIFDELFMRLDNRLDWHIINRQLYPLYRFLKLSAVGKFFQMDITWHQKRNSGTLVGKVANGVEKVNEICNGLSWEFIPTLVQTVLSLLPLLFISPLAALIALISAGIFGAFVLRNHRERKPLKESRHDLYEIEWRDSIEIVQSYETNKMFGQSDRLLREQRQLHDQIIEIGSKEAHLGIYFYNRWQIRVLRIARRIIWAIWAYQLYAGSMDIPTLVFANTLIERLFNSFWRFSRLIERASEAAEGAERLANLLDEQPSEKSNGTITEPAETPVSIQMEGVQFSYEEEYTDTNGGLHSLNLEIPGGSVVALVGPSGAGKTTIRKVITGLIPIQGGRIKVGGIDITNWDEKMLLAQYSYVPQGDDVFLFNGTIRANIAFAKPEASFEEVQRAAELAGIRAFIEHLEEGYDTIVGERGKRLSGGQKQRLALARAIIADRPILILDEATSAVDAITEEEIQSKMRQILAGKTAIIIAHRLSTIWDIADKIVVMDHGRKVEEGTHEELVKLNGLYATMAALQTK